MTFTNKEQVRCMIATSAYRIEGEMHVLSGSRLTDALNSKAKDFVAITDASVFPLHGQDMLWKAEYVAVNRDSIAMVVPLEED